MRRVQSRLLDDFLRSMGGRRRRDGGLPFFALFFRLAQFPRYIYLARLCDSNCGVEARIE